MNIIKWWAKSILGIESIKPVDVKKVQTETGEEMLIDLSPMY